MHSSNGTIFSGVLGDGSHIAVHKLQCENEKDLIQVLPQIEVLSAIVHRNMAHLLGCCIETGYTPLVVYEYPGNGTPEEHLHQRGGQKPCLDWYRRLTIAAETANILASLYENSPPVFHQNLKSGCILLDDDYSVKLAGFGLINSNFNYGSHLFKNNGGSLFCENDVYDMGVLLLDIISSSTHLDSPTLALQKIRAGKLEEIFDPLLYYNEQSRHRQEQIQIVSDLAKRCLLFGADGKLGMMDVARELVHITKEDLDGGIMRAPTQEETFSNSSLLQIVSMSPDSINVP